MRVRQQASLVDPQALLDFSGEHLAYEIEMLFRAIRAASAEAELNALEPGLAAFVKNAVVETFANHLRNLVTFLYPEEFDQWKGDILATDFFESEEVRQTWLQQRPSISGSLMTAKRRADKEMAHITVERIGGTSDAKGWAFGPLGAEILLVLQGFARAADAARLHGKVRQLLDCDG
jgi:hypothetical protein